MDKISCCKTCVCSCGSDENKYCCHWARSTSSDECCLDYMAKPEEENSDEDTDRDEK